MINARWRYNPENDLQVCFTAPHGTGPHAHFQSHPATVQRVSIDDLASRHVTCFACHFIPRGFEITDWNTERYNAFPTINRVHKFSNNTHCLNFVKHFYSGAYDINEAYISQIIVDQITPSPGFVECNGQLLPIFSNTTLYALIGSIYGGNGTTHFRLPNLNQQDIKQGYKFYICTYGTFPSRQ